MLEDNNMANNTKRKALKLILVLIILLMLLAIAIFMIVYPFLKSMLGNLSIN